MILIVLIRIRKYTVYGSVLEQKENFDDVTDESHLFDKLHFVWQENLQWFYSWIKQQKIWNAFVQG